MPEDTPDVAVTPVGVIICDDIRHEITGKQILIGVYSEDIIVPSIPANIVLCFWIQFRMKGSQFVNARIKVTDPSGNISGEGSVSLPSRGIDISEVGTSAISMPALPISILQTGKISVYWSNDEEEFSIIGEKRVIVGHVATPFTVPL